MVVMKFVVYLDGVVEYFFVFGYWVRCIRYGFRRSLVLVGVYSIFFYFRVKVVV